MISDCEGMPPPLVMTPIIGQDTPEFVECPRCHLRFLSRPGRRHLRRHMTRELCDSRLSRSSLHHQSPAPLPPTADSTLSLTMSECGNVTSSIGSTDSRESRLPDDPSSDDLTSPNCEFSDVLVLTDDDFIEVPDFDSLDYDFMLDDF